MMETRTRMMNMVTASCLACIAGMSPLGAGDTADVGGLKISADCPLAKNEHPRLLLSRAELEKARERVRGPMASELQELMKIEAKIEENIKRKNNPDPLVPAVLYALTGDRKYMQVLRDGDCMPRKASAHHGELILDLVWDALTPEEIKGIADEAAGGMQKKEWQWFREYYGMALLLYGTGHHDKEFAEAIAKMHTHLKQEKADLNAWAAGRGGDVNCFGYIGNHSVLPHWPALQAYSTALGEDLWPESRWSEYLAAYHVYHHRPDREAMVHVDMAQHEDLKPHGGLGAVGCMEFYWCRVPVAFKDGLTKWWLERYCYGTSRGLVGKILWPAPDVQPLPPERFPPSRLFPTPGYAVM